MLKIQELTKEEKFKVYNKLSKKELISMLISNNELVDILSRALNSAYEPILINDLQKPIDNFEESHYCLRDHIQPGEVTHIYCPCPRCSPQC